MICIPSCKSCCKNENVVNDCRIFVAPEVQSQLLNLRHKFSERTTSYKKRALTSGSLESSDDDEEDDVKVKVASNGNAWQSLSNPNHLLISYNYI